MLIVRSFFRAGNGNRNFAKYGSSSIVYLCFRYGLFAAVVGNIETRQFSQKYAYPKRITVYSLFASISILHNFIILLEVLNFQKFQPTPTPLQLKPPLLIIDLGNFKTKTNKKLPFIRQSRGLGISSISLTGFLLYSDSDLSC